jgi:ABC-type Fe3+-hydroxamate transport system substrate-binding protein
MTFIQDKNRLCLITVISNSEERNREIYHNREISLCVRNDKKRKLGFKSLLIISLSLISIISFSQKVNKVISLAPSITENIYLLGAEDKLIACTSYCTQAVSDGVEQIGSTVDVNVEKIFAMQSDLVLTMLMTKQQDIEAMIKLGIKVVVIPSPKSFNEICEQTIQIGKLIGSADSAQKIIQQTKQTVDSLKQKCSAIKNNPKIFFQMGANPIFTVLGNTFMNDYILFCNGENIANGMTKGTMTRESVLLKNPDIIIVATMGGFGEEEQKIWRSYNGLKAAENGKVFLIDSETSCSPTPDSFAKAFADVYKFVTQ